MINIVYIISNLRKSGPVNVLLDTCKFLNREKYNPIIVTLKKESPDRSIKTKFEALGITVISFEFNNYYLELFPGKAAKTIKSRLTDYYRYIVHAHCYHASILLKYFQTYKTVETIHCIAKEDYLMKYGKILGYYMVRRFCNSLEYCSCPVAISQYMMEYYKQYCDDKLTLIHNGVDFRIDDAEKESRQTICKKLNIDSSKKIILYSGYFSARKNAPFIVREIMKSQRRDFICIFIGKGELLDKCKSIAASDERLRFDGYVFNVRDYLSVADLYVSASKSEGLPLAVLEALNMGIPCLLSDILPHQEIASAIELPSVKTFALADNCLLNEIDSFLDTEYNREDLSERSYRLFSANTMAKKYEQLYNALI